MGNLVATMEVATFVNAVPWLYKTWHVCPRLTNSWVRALGRRVRKPRANWFLVKWGKAVRIPVPTYFE